MVLCIVQDGRSMFTVIWETVGNIILLKPKFIKWFLMKLKSATQIAIFKIKYSNTMQYKDMLI